MTTSPRVSRFSKQWTDTELDAAVARIPEAISLNGTDITRQAELLDKTLRRVFLPDRQIRSFLRESISIARAHAENHFATDTTFIQGLYSKSPWGFGASPAICLTGLAGVGKSELLKALSRLLGDPGTISIRGHRELPLVSSWPVTLSDGVGLNTLLRPFIFDDDPIASAPDIVPVALEKKTRGIHVSALLPLARKKSWREGVCLLPVDEFQRVSLGADANAKATRVLLDLLGIGPRLIYCANFDLVYKLKRRASQDKQRLLSRPMVLLPLQEADPDWIAYLTALKAIAPDVLLFDPATDAKEIHQYTFGIKRLVVELIVAAFKVSKLKKPRTVIGRAELLRGYQSLDYSVNRDDVEVLHRQQISSEITRDDLVCPFQSTEIVQSVCEVSKAIESFEMKIEDALLDSALTPKELAARAILAPENTKNRPAAKVIRFRNKAATKDELLAGAAVLQSID